MFATFPANLFGHFWKVQRTHMLHVWYTYLHDWVIFRVNVGKYSSPMEHMGQFSTVHLPWIAGTGLWRSPDGPRPQAWWCSVFPFVDQKKHGKTNQQSLSLYHPYMGISGILLSYEQYPNGCNGIMIWINTESWTISLSHLIWLIALIVSKSIPLMGSCW